MLCVYILLVVFFLIIYFSEATKRYNNVFLIKVFNTHNCNFLFTYNARWTDLTFPQGGGGGRGGRKEGAPAQ